MNKGNLMNNTKTRRKGSMLQDSLSKIKYFLMLAVLLVLPMQAIGQGVPIGVIPIIDQTDTGVDRLVAFYDTRGRDTLIQVTNTSSEKVNIHIQLFDVAGVVQECEECNVDDMLTPFDTHVYDIENLVTNSGPLLTPVPFCTGLATDASYGFMVVSLTKGPPGSLIGMFRIIDEAGYEYRTNAVGTEDFKSKKGSNRSIDQVVNFSSANGNNLSDLVGITYVSLNPDTVLAGPGISTTFGDIFDEILIYDQIEFDTSCSPTTFSCAVGFLDKAIDNSLPNSKGQVNRLCGTSTLNSNNAGWLDMPFSRFTCTPASGVGDADGNCGPTPHFVGFIGLNNGDGTGSMDSWWEVGLFAEIAYDGPMEPTELVQ